MSKLLNALILAALSHFALACDADWPGGASCRAETQGIALTEAQRQLAPNLRLVSMQLRKSARGAGMPITPGQLAQLRQQVDAAARESFADSKTGFEVTARYTLDAQKPATFHMKTRGGAQERAALLRFYNTASRITAIRSRRDKALVIFHYRITAAAPPGARD